MRRSERFIRVKARSEVLSYDPQRFGRQCLVLNLNSTSLTYATQANGAQLWQAYAIT